MLREAQLYNNFLTGSIPELLTSGGSNRELSRLRLYNNRITGTLPASWSALAKSLRQLDLHDNKITGPVPVELSTMQIRELRLDMNEMTGPLPLGAEYKWLTTEAPLKVLRFERNNFDRKLTMAEQTSHSDKIPFFGADGYLRNHNNPSSKTFRICDTRIELYGEVIGNETMKWSEVTDKNWLLAFDACFDEGSKYRHMTWDQKQGEMPQLDIVSDKGKFAAQMERFRRKFPKEYAYIPVSFIIPSQLIELKAAIEADKTGAAPTNSKLSKYKDDGMAYWLVKPRASCCGRGIRLINTFDEVPKGKNDEYSGYIVQRFMSNPYPIVGYNPKGEPGGYKFIIRLFVFCTTFEPLSVHIVPDGPMFYTRQPHSLKSKLWKDRSNFISDYFFTHAQADLGTTLSRLRINYMKGTMGHDDREIWRKIKHATVKTLLPLSERLSQQMKELQPYDRNTYHIWGYDISVDDNQEPVVIEVNAHPMTDLEICKTNDTHKGPVVKQDRELKMDMIDRLVHLIGLEDNSDGAQYAAAKKDVDEKAAKFGWEHCDEEVGVLIPKRNGKPCLTPIAYKDIIASELEMRRKGPLECAFPFENGKNLAYLLEGKLPRTDVVVEWWEESKAHKMLWGNLADELVPRPAYISPVVNKTFERDLY
jgi:hypothetical protein